jgi:hypothetical protein
VAARALVSTGRGIKVRWSACNSTGWDSRTQHIALQPKAADADQCVKNNINIKCYTSTSARVGAALQNRIDKLPFC